MAVPNSFFKNYSSYRVYSGCSGVETSGVGEVKVGFSYNSFPATGSGLTTISIGSQYWIDKNANWFTVRGDLQGDHLLGFTVVLYK